MVEIAAICGGLGGARLARALLLAVSAEGATFVTNVADDWWVDRLRVCPDTDAVLYALAGLYDFERGWGVLGDEISRPSVQAPWFSLGERDRAHHERRTALLHAGATPSEATAALVRDLGIGAAVVPASDEERLTRVRVAGGVLEFQEWLVREHAPGPVLEVTRGPGTPTPAPGVLAALEHADVVVLSSSSPVASLDPTLSLDGVADLLRQRVAAGRPVVLISPVVGSTPTNERDRRRHHARAELLAARSVEHTPEAVIAALADLATHVVLDPVDQHLAARLPGHLTALVAPVLDQSEAALRRLAQACVEPTRV